MSAARKRTSKAGTMARLYTSARADAANTTEALRLQAQAWRLCALISLTDQVRGAKAAQWLLFQSVPWVNGEALRKFIADSYADAEAAGLATGVFTTTGAL